MPWNEVKTMDQKKNFIDLVLREELPFSECCRQFSVSRKTGYKWFGRYQELGLEGLLEEKRTPNNITRALDQEVIKQVLEIRQKRPCLGPRKIKARLERLYPTKKWPAASSIGNILDRYQLTRVRKKRHRVPLTAPLSECKGINDLWSVDFKGSFQLNGTKYEPLTICDAHSRFLIRCLDLKSKDIEHVWAIYEDAFYEYGLPLKIRTDNGPPFGSCGAGRLTRLGVKLIKAGVIPEWINPGNPQENGRHERMHRVLEETLVLSPIEEESAFDDFIDFYNYERPHEALDQNTPSAVFRNSPRKWYGQLRSPIYSKEFEIREASKVGQIEYKQKKVFLSSCLAGEPVGIKVVDKGFEVFYGPIYLGKVEEENRLIKPEKLGRPKGRKVISPY